MTPSRRAVERRLLGLALVAALFAALVAPALALAAPVTPAAALPGPGAPVAPVEDGTVRIVIGLGPATRSADVDTAASVVGARTVRDVEGLRARVVEVPAGRRAAALRRLAAVPGVRFAEEDGESVAMRVPTDPEYSAQWGLPLVGAPAAWDATVGVEDVVIAVLDTGVDADHEDLHGAVLPASTMLAPSAQPADPPNHGTLAAGVAAARGDNGKGGVGLCWRCRILPITVLDENGRGANSLIAAGIREAVDRGARVISLSLGSRTRSQLMADAVHYAWQHDVVVVAAAGNYGTQEPVYPAAFDTVVGVAGSTGADNRYGWSSWGHWAELAAPGCNLGTRTPTADGPEPYGVYCGTSSAAPFVAGVVGLLRSAHPDASPIDVAEALRSAAQPVDFTAWGRVDAGSAMGALADRMVHGRTPVPGSLAPVDAGVEPVGTDVDRDPGPGARADRVAGPDRFATAAELSRTTFTPGVARAYLATGADFPDALSAGAAASAAAGPVLLTPRTSLPGVVADELRRLAPGEVVVVGGLAAVDDTVLDEVTSMGIPVRRVAGRDRFATAAALAADAQAAPGGVVYVATGANFPDALAGIPAAARDAAPLLLVTRDQVPAATAEALTALQPSRVVLLGGTGAISTTVAAHVQQLADPVHGVQRLAGPDRFATAGAVARSAFPGTVETLHLATGSTFPDALAGGPAAAAHDGPLLLVTRDSLPGSTADELRRTAPDRVVVLGGTAAISDAVAAAARQTAAEAQPQ